MSAVIATSVRPSRTEYGTTWRHVQNAVAGMTHELLITGQGIEPTFSRRNLEIALEDIGELEAKLSILRIAALENLHQL
jgi:hypothetical protein